MCDITSPSRYANRVEPDPRDGLLLEELRRSVQAMPLDADVVSRLIFSLKQIEGQETTEQPTSQVSSKF